MTIREALGRARHDVAKYAAMTAENLGPPPWEPRLRDAVARDVLATDGERPVWEVWAERRVGLAAIADDPAIAEIDRRIASLRAREAGLREPGAPGVDQGLVADLIALGPLFRDLETRVARQHP